MYVLLFILYEYVNVYLILFLLSISAGQYLLHDFCAEESRAAQSRAIRAHNSNGGDDRRPESLPECIADRFISLQELLEAVKEAGLHHLNPIVAVDFTASNEWQGRKTFAGRCLHELRGNKISNPYQKFLSIMIQMIPFRQYDLPIPIYGFGAKNNPIFSLRDDVADTNKHILELYNSTVRGLSLGGPSSFMPVIDKALEFVKKTSEFHLLIILTDGQLRHKDRVDSLMALSEASSYPLSIVAVGMGDGPFELMTEFDDHVPYRKFDNFQYVEILPPDY